MIASSATPPIPSSPRPPRLASLDIGRMLAALTVVLYHADAELMNGKFPLFQFGFRGVAFFMVLSGYVLAYPYFEHGPGRERSFQFPDYLKRRIARIVPPYYAVLLICSALNFVGIGSKENVVTRSEIPLHLLAHLLFVHTFFLKTIHSLSSVCWTLGLEWQYYLLFPLLFLALKRYSAGWTLSAIVVLSLLTRFMILRFFPAYEYLLEGFFLSRLPEFALGMALSFVIGRGQVRSALWLGLAAAVGLTVGLLFPSKILDALMGGCGAFLALCLLRFGFPTWLDGKIVRFLQFLGQASYSTYLVHPLAGKAYLLALAKFQSHHVAPGMPILFLGYALAGHLAGVGFYLAVEMPLTKRARRLLKLSSHLVTESHGTSR